MSQFPFRDFGKKFNDLSSNNFPGFDKKDDLQDTLSFKFSSKAQKGFSFGSSIKTINGTKTEADFNGKMTCEDLEGVEFSFKAKSKPALETALKFNDKIVPLEGASFTIKDVVSAPSTQTVSGIFGYANETVNVNVGYTQPVDYEIFDFFTPPTGDDEQKKSVFFDFAAKPLEDKNVYVGGSGTLKLPGSDQKTYYTGKLSVVAQEAGFTGGASVCHKVDVKTENEVKVDDIATCFSAFGYTEVDDVSGGAQVTYSPADSEGPYKGFGFTVVAGLQRDSDSVLSTKLQVIPDTTVSVGYEQKLSSAVKLSFGYAFLLSKTSSEKAKSSAYQFGLEVSH